MPLQGHFRWNPVLLISIWANVDHLTETVNWDKHRLCWCVCGHWGCFLTIEDISWPMLTSTDKWNSNLLKRQKHVLIQQLICAKNNQSGFEIDVRWHSTTFNCIWGCPLTIKDVHRHSLIMMTCLWIYGDKSWHTAWTVILCGLAKLAKLDFIGNDPEQ